MSNTFFKLFKGIITTMLLFSTLVVYSQTNPFPLSGNKLRLGYQTTAMGLIIYGTGAPTFTPASELFPYTYVDRTNYQMYNYIPSVGWKTINKSVMSGTATYIPLFTSDSTLASSIMFQTDVGGPSGYKQINLGTTGRDKLSAPRADLYYNNSGNGPTTTLYVLASSSNNNDVTGLDVSASGLQSYGIKVNATGGGIPVGILSQANVNLFTGKLGLGSVNKTDISTDSTLLVGGSANITSNLKVGGRIGINSDTANRPLFINDRTSMVMPYGAINERPTKPRFGDIRIARDTILIGPISQGGGNVYQDVVRLEMYANYTKYPYSPDRNNFAGTTSELGWFGIGVYKAPEYIAPNPIPPCVGCSAYPGSPLRGFIFYDIPRDSSINIAISTGLALSNDSTELINTGVIEFNTGTTGLTADSAGVVTLGGVLTTTHGGTGADTLKQNKLLVGNSTNPVLQPDNLEWNNSDSLLSIGGRVRISTINIDTFAISNLAPSASVGKNIWIGDGGQSLNLAGVGAEGSSNTSIGFDNLKNITTGNGNTSVGYLSLNGNTTGSANVAVGTALLGNTSGQHNVGIGIYPLTYNTTGFYNIGIGTNAGSSTNSGLDNITPNNSIFIGDDTRASGNGQTNQIVIGSGGRGNGSNTTTIGNTSTTATILPAGKLGVGTTTPDSTLTVTGGIRTSTSIKTGSDATINGVRVGRGTSDNINSVAVGSEALISATSAGNSNTAVGYRALKANTTGYYNTAIGIEALTTNTTIANLTAVGFQALRANTTGYYNTAVGSESLKATTTGNNNTAIGIGTLRDNTTGGGNTAMGSLALLLPTGANYNVAIGTEALENDSTGSSNVAVGSFALTSNKTGNENTGVGYASLVLNTTGVNNSALGTNSARGNTTGGTNTAIGSYSLYTNSTGSNNVAIGSAALFANTASSNTGIGVLSLEGITTGDFNTAIGNQSGQYITAGTANQTSSTSVYLGYDTRASANGNTNEIVIGASARGNGSNTTTIGNTSTISTFIPAGKLSIASTTADSTLRVVGTGNFTSNVRVGGNLGVNTATPGSRLTVIGTASLGNGAANSTGSGYNATITSGGAKATTANNTLLALLTNDALVSNPLGLFMDLSANSTATSRHARLQVGEYGTGNYRSLVLQPDGGSVGIRNSSPDSTLTVTGTGNFSSNFRIGGNLGVGTATPSYTVQATKASEIGMYLNASGSGNIAPPTTYAPGAGGLLYAFGSQAGDNFRRFLDIVADGSAGSAGSVIRFFTGNTATAERARINQDGELLVGTSTDNGAFNLQVSGTGYFSTGLRVDYTSAFDANTVFQMPNTSTKGAKGFVWATYSDARIKNNFDTIQNAIETISKLRPLHYDQYDSEVKNGEIITGENKIRTVGFIAQEVVSAIPQAVQVGNETQLWGMDYTKIIPFLTKAIQEQQTQIESLKKELEEIKAKINK